MHSIPATAVMLLLAATGWSQTDQPLTPALPAREAPATELPAPEPNETVSSKPVRSEMTIVGSVTMDELLRRWSLKLLDLQPGLQVHLQSVGSNSTPLALAEGTARIGTMSRRMTRAEHQHIAEQQSLEPVEFQVAYDAISIIVNPQNPLRSISVAQLDQVFSAGNGCATNQPPQLLNQWRQLEQFPAQPWLLGQRQIQRYGRLHSSGTLRWFRQHALCSGDFHRGVNALPSHGAIVQAVQSNPAAIGYVGKAFVTAGVKPLALHTTDPAEPLFPDNATIAAGRYPMARPLFLYILPSASSEDTTADTPVNNLSNSGTRLPDTYTSLLQLIYSPQGQQIVQQSGFTPLNDAQLQQQKQQYLSAFRHSAPLVPGQTAQPELPVHTDQSND